MRNRRALQLSKSFSLMAALIVAHSVITGRDAHAIDVLDTSFSGDGIQTTAVTAQSQARNVVVQPDGKIVAIGFADNGSANYDFAVARYNVDGSPDTSFGTGGKTTTPVFAAHDQAYAVALQSDGKIVIGGWTDSGTNADFALVRYNSNGTLDTSFDGDGKVTTAFNLGGDNRDDIQEIAIQSDGKIVVAGYAATASNRDVALARYNVNGSLDTSFDGDGKLTFAVGAFNDYGLAMTLQADGKILVGGSTYVSGTNTASVFVARLLPSNGAFDPLFGTNGKVTTAILAHADGNSLTVQPDGKIILGGLADNTGNSGSGATADFVILRLNNNGVPDTTFDGDGVRTYDFGTAANSISAVRVQADGKIVAVGLTRQGSYDAMGILRVNADGSPDTTFDGDGKVILDPGPQDDALYGLDFDANGNIVAAGLSENSSGVAQFAVVRLLGLPTPGVWNLAAAQGTGGSNLGITGQINPANLSTTVSVEYGTTNAFGSTQSIGTFAGNTLQNFNAMLYPGGLTVGTTHYYRIVATNANGTTTSAIQSFFYGPGTLDFSFGGGDGIASLSVGASEDVAGAVAVQADGKIVIAGHSAPSGGNYDPVVMRFNADGTPDSTFGGGDGIATITTLPGNEQLNAVAIQPDGKIVAAGFSNSASDWDFLIVRFLADGTPDSTFDGDGVRTISATGTNIARAVAIQPDGMILVGGYSYNGSNYDFALARLTSAGGISQGLTHFAVGTTDDWANAMALGPNGSIYLAGESVQATNNDFAVIKLTSAWGLDSSFGTGGKSTVAFTSAADIGMALALQPDGKLILAGRSNNNAPDVAVARLTALGALDTTFGTGGKVTTPVQLSDYGFAVAVQSDGRIVVGGSSNNPTADILAIRYNADGSLDSSFDGDGKKLIPINPGADDVAYGMALQPDGNMLFAGRTVTADGLNDMAVVRVLAFPQPGVWNLSAAPAITTPGVMVSGQIDPGGFSTTVIVEYGASASLGSLQALGTFAGTGLQSLSTALNFAGLAKGTTLYYRIVATNANGTTTSSIQSYVVPYTFEVVASMPGGTGPNTLERGPLHVASDGTIYGTSNIGGTNNFGTLYKVSPTGAVTVLVNFTGTTGAAPGANPSGGVVADGSSFLWGTTQNGGASNLGTIYKFNLTTNTLTTVVQFAGTTTAPRGRRPVRELVSDAAGFFWGTTYKGGASDFGTVFKINKSTGAFSTIAEFAGIATAPRGDGGDQALTFDGANTMWGTTSAGGTGNFGTLFKINTSTGALTTIKEFTGTTGSVMGSDPDGALVFETSDVLWGSTWSGGTSDLGTVFTYTISTNTFTTLFNLNSSTGNKPVASFYRDDSQGLMWNVASHGGVNGLGTLFTIDRTGARSLTSFASFTGTSGPTPGTFPFGALTSDGKGNLIGTTLNGGPADAGLIFRIRFGPTPVTTTATNISGYNAILNGTVNPNGAATTFRFAYGSTPESLTNLTPVQTLGATRIPTTVSASVLLPSNATFYYRLEAENAEQLEKQVGAILSLNMPALPGDANRALASAQLSQGAAYHYVSNQTGEVSGGVGAAWDIKPGINYFEDKLLDAAAKYRLAIAESPSNPEGHRGLIQTVYERLVAQTFEGNAKFADTAKIRLDLGTVGNGVGGPIDAEIASYGLARDKYQTAVNIFLSIARDPVEGTYLFPSVQPSGLWQQTPPPGAPRSLAAEASRLFEAFARAFGMLSRTEARLRQLMYFRAYRDPASNPNGFQPRAPGGFVDTINGVADNLEEIQLLASLYTHLDSYNSADLPEASGGISDLRKLAASAGSKNVFFSFGFDKNLVSSFSEYTPGFVPFLFAQGAYASSRSFDNLYDFANELVTISAGTDGTGGRDAAARTASQAAVDNWIQLKQKTQQIKSDYEARLIELCGQRLVPVDPAFPNGPTKIAPDLLGYAFRPDIREIDPAIQQKGAIYAQWQKIELARTRYSQAVQDFVDLGTEVDIIEQSAAEQAAVPIAAGRNVAKIIYSTGEQITLLQKQASEAVSETRVKAVLYELEAEKKSRSGKAYAALKSGGVAGLGSVSEASRAKEAGKEGASMLKALELSDQLDKRLTELSVQATNIVAAEQAQIAFTYAMSAAEGIELRAKERIRTVLVKGERLKLSILLAQQEIHAQETELENMLGRVDFLLQEYRQALLLESENAMLKPDFRFLRDQAIESASDAFRFAQEWVYLTAKAAQYRFMTPAQFATASTLIERTLIARKGVELRDILTSLKALSNNFYLNGIPGNGQVKKVVLSLRDYLVQNNLVSRDARGQLIAGAPASFQAFPMQGGSTLQSVSDREWTAFLSRNITGFPSAPKLTLTFSTSMEPGYEGRSNPLWFGDQFGQFIVSGTEPGAKGLFVNILGDLPAPTVLQPAPEVQVSQEGACYIPFKSWNSWAPGEFAMRTWTLPKRTTSPTALIAQDSLTAFTAIEPFANEEMNERSPYCDHWTLVVDGRQGYGKVLLTTNLDKIKDIQIGLSIKGFTGQ